MINEKARSMAAKEKEDFKVRLKEFIGENLQTSNYIKMVPMLHQKLFYRLYKGEKSYSKAVKAKCLDCTCFEKLEIRNCKVVTCPLFNLRPYRYEKEELSKVSKSKKAVKNA